MLRLPEKMKRFQPALLSKKVFPGLYLTVSLVLLIVSIWLFGRIAEDVATHDPITLVDARFSTWLHARAFEPLTTFMLLVTSLHSGLGVTVMTLAVSAYSWFRRLRIWTVTLMLAVFGGMALNFLLKNLFLRPRPHFNDPML